MMWTADFWLGVVCTSVYFLLLAVFLLLWWLHRDQPTRPPESRAIAEARREIERAWR